MIYRAIIKKGQTWKNQLINMQENFACPVIQPDSQLFNRPIFYRHYASGQPLELRVNRLINRRPVDHMHIASAHMQRLCNLNK